MHWQLVTTEETNAYFARKTSEPLTSPRVAELSPRAADQVNKVWKIIQLACKSELVGDGQVRVSASGYCHHDPEQMPTDQRDFIAISIGRIG